ncbi:uncharacterized protein UV8b_03312 [Ustilaginoidea virens]|uniref:HNH nuclease domain-containing protein n=1 Tax=Ustilaginoidea virens TaxID=1159556 RepID=A0A8E5MGX7_USTVR|nr:uncharacterized protein UV8b_03312 [Ustilaginoidea virens]QUC19071.1 hypothetical protein UV8b_03312 [Ustilaginoidea virens]
MSNATVTPQARAHGWNVHFLAGTDDFAGLFLPPASDTLSFRDIIDELRLCFELPHDPRTQDSTDPWRNIAFYHIGFVNVGPEQSSQPPPIFVWGHHLDLPVSAPAGQPLFTVQPWSRYQVVRHKECDLANSELLEAHIQAGCATHIPYPSLRQDSRYLPPNKGSRDPNFAQLPYRKTIRPRGSSSPSKRSASGSVSPTKDDTASSRAFASDDDTTSLAIPYILTGMSAEVVRKTILNFRTSCLVESNTCAVSGKGRGWCANPAIGPGVQACHIVPQQHYHIYPLPEPFSSEGRYSHGRLSEAWRRTWSAKNGILLSKTLHELFDLRLFSIHPDTLRVRIFVPYDMLEEYHGRPAQLPPNVDRKALRHHYEMCCIENMAAAMPLEEHLPPSYTGANSIASGSASVLGSDSHITSMSPKSARGLIVDAHTGDPVKRRSRQRRNNTDNPGLVNPDSASFSANDADEQAMSESGKRHTMGGNSTRRRKRRRNSDRENMYWANAADNEMVDNNINTHVYTPIPFSIQKFLSEV